MILLPDGQRLKTHYKNLVVSGCSFTSNLPANNDKPFQWPNLISMWTGAKLHNLAIPGAGNSHVSRSLRLFLSSEKLDPKDTLVLVMWTGIGRVDFMTDKSASSFGTCYPFTYNYTNNTELVLGGNWWNIRHPSPVQKVVINYAKFQDEESLALSSYLEMQSLDNFLKQSNYTNFQTSFLSYNKPEDIKGDAVTGANYWQFLENNNLSLEKSNWLDLPDNNYYGNFCKDNNLLQEDEFHPSSNGAEKWCLEVLIPDLIQKGVFYYE